MPRTKRKQRAVARSKLAPGRLIYHKPKAGFCELQCAICEATEVFTRRNSLGNAVTCGKEHAREAAFKEGWTQGTKRYEWVCPDCSKVAEEWTTP